MTNLDEKKTVISWAFYDWANSAFATTVMAGFFPVFFKAYWCNGVESTLSTARLGFANSIAGITVALSAPILGAIADGGSARKKFLVFFALMGAVMTSGLYLVHQGQWVWAAMIYICATIGFCGGNIFYDSLITGVASPERMDFVSALGYSLGYLGGALLFTLNVWMVQQPSTFGFADKTAAVKFAFLTVGIWWVVFSLPIFFFVKEPPNPQAVKGRFMIRAGFVRLRGTFSEIRSRKVVFLFLIAYWLYIDGVDTIVRMAVDYGMSIGFLPEDLIKALLLTNFIGFPAALLFGYIGQRIGAKRGILITIGAYVIITICASFMHDKNEFYLLAAAIGLVQGGIQALSRSYFARLIPVEKSAEFFGFYNMLGKFAVVIGPALVGTVGLGVKRMGFSSDISARVGISSIALLFILGGILLCFVNNKPMSRPAEDNHSTGEIV